MQNDPFQAGDYAELIVAPFEGEVIRQVRFGEPAKVSFTPCVSLGVYAFRMGPHSRRSRDSFRSRSCLFCRRVSVAAAVVIPAW